MSNLFIKFYLLPLVSAVSVFISLTLLTLQSWRRFYETFFVSVFSDSSMNVAHYAVGFIHYFGAVSAVLIEAPGLTPPSIGNVRETSSLCITARVCPLSLFQHVISSDCQLHRLAELCCHTNMGHSSSTFLDSCIKLRQAQK